MSAVSLASGESAPCWGTRVLADVVHVGTGAKACVKEGDRVVVDPVLGCEARAEVPCGRCAIGEYATCHRFGTGSPRGIMLGACSQLPGGFGERMVAHKSQIFRVPDALSDERAVLTEPLAVGAHAALRHPPADGERVLVVGGGIIAFSVLWAIRELCPSAEVTLFTVEGLPAVPLARSLGAARAWSLRGGLADGSRRRWPPRPACSGPRSGEGFLTGGFSRVYDCVGTRASLDDAMRV